MTATYKNVYLLTIKGWKNEWYSTLGATSCSLQANWHQVNDMTGIKKHLRGKDKDEQRTKTAFTDCETISD